MNSKTLTFKKKLITVGVFAFAMGFLEAIVVIYLRKIFYPQGFDFPLSIMSPEIISIEWFREITTIIMLVTIGILAGSNNFERFLYFLYTFAIWDIVYYIGLKLFLNWPASILNWDILFLIPIPWISPVLAPIICSLTMIVMSVLIIYFIDKGYKIKTNYKFWITLIVGAILIFITFMWDYSKIIIENNFLGDFFNLLNNEKFIKIITEFKPLYFNWIIFIIGEILIIFSITHLLFINIYKTSRIK